MGKVDPNCAGEEQLFWKGRNIKDLSRDELLEAIRWLFIDNRQQKEFHRQSFDLASKLYRE